MLLALRKANHHFSFIYLFFEAIHNSIPQNDSFPCKVKINMNKAYHYYNISTWVVNIHIFSSKELVTTALMVG